MKKDLNTYQKANCILEFTVIKVSKQKETKVRLDTNYALNQLKVGDTVSFSKTISEADVYMFAGITGDFSSNHVNEMYIKKSIFRKRIAHGALSVGFMSTTSTIFIERVLEKRANITVVNLGYDKIRFIEPVYFGDTINVSYVLEEIHVSERRTLANINITNQNDKLVTLGKNWLKWLDNNRDLA